MQPPRRVVNGHFALMVILMPKISVIIPTYNRSGMVKEAISSVLAQTEQDLEVVMLNGRSIHGASKREST